MNHDLIVQTLALCDKVMEVVNNNDWPTEEGHNRADEPPCFIEVLVNNIRWLLNKETGITNE